MSRSINDSVKLLSETLNNCKTNLKDKKVTNVDNIKISNVDEKIAEIQSGESKAIGNKIKINSIMMDGSTEIIDGHSYTASANVKITINFSFIGTDNLFKNSYSFFLVAPNSNLYYPYVYGFEDVSIPYYSTIDYSYIIILLYKIQDNETEIRQPYTVEKVASFTLSKK